MTKKPDWLLVPHRKNENRKHVMGILNSLGLNAVCTSAMCPNEAECFESKTATFMILGTNCTRNCQFCNISHESPQDVDPNEPTNIALATKELGLKHVVVTSVTRDDLPEGGASQFCKTILALKEHCPDTIIEVLIPDFNGNIDALKMVIDSGPHIIAHNVETVPTLYESVRPKAVYSRSLELIANIKKNNSNIYSKSSIMVGFGETRNQVLQVMEDLRGVDCDFLTIGQYLAPSKRHLPVYEYIHPDIFEYYRKVAYDKGFKYVASGPFVRSSYQAHKAIKGI